MPLPPRRAIIAGIIAGAIGFGINCIPLPLFPGVYLLLGSVVVIAAAVGFGATAGGIAGGIAGLGTFWLWNQSFPFSPAILMLEGAWVGWLVQRRPKIRPLLATMSYWLLVGSGLTILVRHFVLELSWYLSALLGLKAVVNAFICSLLAELLLLSLAHILGRRESTRGVFRLSLSSTIGLVLMIGIVLTAMIGVIAKGREDRERILSEAQESNTKLSTSLSQAISDHLQTYRRAISITSGLLENRQIGFSETDRLSALLAISRAKYPDMESILVTDASGNAVAFSPNKNSDGTNPIGLEFKDQALYRDLLRTRSTVFSGIDQSPGGNAKPSTAIAVPVMNRDGGMEGFVLAVINLGRFTELARASSGGPDQIQVLITDRGGSVIANTSEAMNGFTISQNIANEPIAAVVGSAGDGNGEYTPRFDASSSNSSPRPFSPRSWVSWSTVPNAGWRIYVERPMRGVQERLAQRYAGSMFLFVGLIIVAVGGTHLVGKRLAHPLVAIEESARKLAQGNLSARPDHSVAFVREFRSLTEAFTQMASNLERSWKEQLDLTIQAESAAWDAQETARRGAALNSLGQEFSSTFDLTAICRAAFRYVKTQLDTSVFAISLVDEATGRITCVYSNVDGAELPVGQMQPISHGDDLLNRCVLSREIQIADTSAFSRGIVPFHFVADPSQHAGDRSAMFLPLIAFDRVLGVLQVHSQEPNQYSLRDSIRLLPLISQIAITINNAQLFDQVARGKIEWETTFDSMSDGVFVFDRMGRLVRVNRAGAVLAGEQPDSAVGRACCEIFQDLDSPGCLVDDAIKFGARIVHESTPLRRGKPLLVVVEPIRIDGSVTGAVFIAHDLSELRRAEEEARSQRELTAQVVELAQEAIFIVDTDGKLAWCNRRLVEATGYSTDEIMSAGIDAITHPDDRQGSRRCVKRALRGHHDVHEARFVRIDGEVRWYKASYTPIAYDSKTSGVLAIARDVTDDRRHAEEMQRTNKLVAVGQLAAGVAHDFNNLLSIILGRVQLLKRREYDAVTTSGFDMIEKAALDGAATVRRLQNFARRELDSPRERVPIDEIIRDVIELTRTRWRDDARANGIDYEFSVNCHSKATVIGASSELREVFTNLLINALDAMPDGGRVSIGTMIGGSQVVIRVADTGGGMSHEVRQRIFEPFFTTKGHAGTGLGLAVSYGIIEKHGGTIEVDSEIGKGTVFTIGLPVHDTSAESSPPNNPNFSNLRMSAVVIDDETLVRETLSEVLTVLGHDVISAASGSEGLRLIESNRIDVVFTDLSMPEMDGWSVAKTVRERWPSIKVLMVTGYAANVDLSGEAARLVDAVIGKPFSIDDVAATIERVFERSPTVSMIGQA